MSDTPGPHHAAHHAGDDRRREDRRSGFIRLADFTIPELRKALITGALLLVVLGLFLYMVHNVLVAIIFGVVLAIYLVPLHVWAEKRLGSQALTAVLLIALVIIPLVVLLTYSWIEISATAEYLNTNRHEVAARITEGLQRLPLGGDLVVTDDLAGVVSRLADSSTAFVAQLQSTLDILVLSVAVFLFTVFYVLTDYRRIAEYLQARIPGRYRGLADHVLDAVQHVAYGALYATFLTQVLKALVMLGLNLVFQVPLAIVLAIATFFIGFLPIVGSWSIYVPVAVYLAVFEQDMVAGAVVLLVGLLGNTVLISMYLRPRIASAKARVLNFYWMFLALVTGVYTFGLVGIIIGPVLIGMLKAVFESVADAPAIELSESSIAT